ncbi:MAG: PilZ domain-containing protein [Treponema sp.]|nr:PilZ domain-containing protein [Treponema sp.]
MLFRKKNQALTDRLAEYQERKSPRLGTPQYDLGAGIAIAGYEGEGQLGNVSASGCSMKSVTYVNIKPDEVYKIEIIPDKKDKIEPFSLKMKLSWTKSSETMFQAGFSLDSSESNRQLKNYVDVLRARGIEPDYGNMGSGSS